MSRAKKKDPVPAVHWNIYPVCTGREWQRANMDFTTRASDVTCKNCLKRIKGMLEKYG